MTETSWYSSICIYWRWSKRYHKVQLFLAVSSCFIVHICSGFGLTSGNLLPYLVSYVRRYSHPRDLQVTDAVHLVACQLSGFGFGALVGGVFDKRLGPRMITLLGGLCMSSGFFLSYVIIEISFYAVLLSYGVLFGIGMGLPYYVALGCAMRWIPEWKGLVAGIVTAGNSVGVLLFDLIQSVYVNPRNESPSLNSYSDHNSEENYYTQPQLLKRLQTLFLVLGGCFAMIIITASIFLVNPHPHSTKEKEKCSLNSTGSNKMNSSHTKPNLNHSRKERIALFKRDKTLAKDIDLSPLQMLLRPSFYILWLKFMFACAITAYIVSFYKSFGLKMVTKDDYYLTATGGIAAVFNLFGRIVLGLLDDFFDSSFALVIQSGIMSCLLLTCYGIGTAGKITYFLWVCFIYFCLGGYFSLYPSAVANRYGSKHMTLNFGILAISEPIGEFFAAFTSQFLIEYMHWYGAFFFFGGLSVFDFLLSLILHCLT